VSIDAKLINDLIRPIFHGEAFNEQQDPGEFFTELVESWNLNRLFEFYTQDYVYDTQKRQATNYPIFTADKNVLIKAKFDVETPFGTPFEPTEKEDRGTVVPIVSRIVQPPPILIYQFMRFTPLTDNDLGAPIQKINDDLINIADQINLSHVMVGSQSAQYDLFAMIVHQGLVVQNGHYVAYINLNLKDRWYLFDDETVVPVSDVEFQKALRQSYMTFWIHRNRDAHDAIGF
jgi:hypothetical protein